MGQLNLPNGAIVYLDASIFIYTLEGNPSYFAPLQPLWEKFQAKTIEIITSELTLMEILVRPLKLKASGVVSTYEQFLTASEIQLIPINQTILKNAAQLRSDKNLKTPDAIHASTAIHQPCTLFLTNDRGFQNTPRLPVVILDQVI